MYTKAHTYIGVLRNAVQIVPAKSAHCTGKKVYVCAKILREEGTRACGDVRTPTFGAND